MKTGDFTDFTFMSDSFLHLALAQTKKLMTKSFSIKSFMHAANEKAKRAFRVMGIFILFLGFWGTICGFFCLRVVLH